MKRYSLLIYKVSIVLVLATGCGTTLKKVTISDEAVKREREKQEDLAFSRFLDKQNRLYNIAYQMLVASGEIFTEKVRPAFGFMLHDKGLYREILGKEYENVAVRHGITEQVTVRYIYPESPADSADLKEGDRILAINDKLLEKESAFDVIKILHNLEYPEERMLTMTVEREGQKIKLTMNGVPASEYAVEMINNDAVNAFANFEGVFITTGMIRFCEKDTELALVVGHEISHIALDHLTKGIVNRLPGMIADLILAATIGVDSQGAIGALTSLVFSKAFEQEADYADLYILARAGYDITGSADFFRRIVK